MSKVSGSGSGPDVPANNAAIPSSTSPESAPDTGPDAGQLGASAARFAALMHPQQRGDKQQSNDDGSQHDDSSDDDGDGSGTARDEAKAENASALQPSPLLSGLIGSNMPGMGSHATVGGSNTGSPASTMTSAHEDESAGREDDNNSNAANGSHSSSTSGTSGSSSNTNTSGSTSRSRSSDDDKTSRDDSDKDKPDDPATVDPSALLSGLIGGNMPGMASPAPAPETASYTATDPVQATSSQSSSYNPSSDPSNPNSSYNPNNVYHPNNPNHYNDQNNSNNNSSSNDSNQQDSNSQSGHTDPAAQLPSGDQLLQTLQGMTGGKDAISAAANSGQVSLPVSELVDRLASRVMVGDATTGTDPTVHISLREDVLQGADISVTRRNGEMVIGFSVSNPELLNQLQTQVNSLQLGLEQRLAEPVRIQITAKPEAGAVDANASGNAGTSGSGEGGSSDGRSRNRQQYQQPDDDDSDGDGASGNG